MSQKGLEHNITKLQKEEEKEFSILHKPFKKKEDMNWNMKNKSSSGIFSKMKEKISAKKNEKYHHFNEDPSEGHSLKR